MFQLLQGSLRRSWQISRVLSRHGCAHLLGSRVASWPWLERRLPMAGAPAPERLRLLFEDIGGTSIKFGQMLALQPDILPLEYCNALFKLLDRVEPFAYSEVVRIVTEELGHPPEEIFDTIDVKPLATASVGQVHVAYLKGRKVAVKVQRPNVETEFSNDIRLIAGAMAVIRGLRLKPLYWMLEPMGEFIGWTTEELDYRNEARYSEYLRRLTSSSQGQYVPEIFGEWTTRRTLVVEFLEATTLLDYLRAREVGNEVPIRRLEARGFEPQRFAANVIDNFLGDAFEYGIYHADLHPANLMILDNSVVGYIDFGITGVMSRYARVHLMRMTLALARGDIDALYDEFLMLSVWNEKGSDLDGFRHGLETLSRGWYEEVGQERKLAATFTAIMTEMLHLSRRTDVMPERDIIKYIRSSIAIDGLIIRFAPEFHLGTYLADKCARYLTWYVRRQRFSVDELLAGANAGVRLLDTGATRGGKVVSQLATGEVPARIEIDSGPAGDAAALRVRALQLAGVIFVGGLMVALNQDDMTLGVNLLTAELVFLAVAILTLTRTLRRLAL